MYALNGASVGPPTYDSPFLRDYTTSSRATFELDRCVKKKQVCCVGEACGVCTLLECDVGTFLYILSQFVL
jgi:hypothetical protein